MIEALRTASLVAAQALYLFLPLLVSAALSGVILRLDWVRVLRRPIDGGTIFRGRRLFGDNKTWRGVAVAVVGSIGAVFVQRSVRADVPAILQVLDYGRTDPFWFGGAMGAGAMVGELPNSFTKRRLSIPPGETIRGWRAIIFYVWDQVDLLTGAWPLVLSWVRPTLSLVAASFVVALAVHPVVALVGYGIGSRKSAR